MKSVATVQPSVELETNTSDKIEREREKAANWATPRCGNEWKLVKVKSSDDSAAAAANRFGTFQSTKRRPNVGSRYTSCLHTSNHIICIIIHFLVGWSRDSESVRRARGWSRDGLVPKQVPPGGL